MATTAEQMSTGGAQVSVADACEDCHVDEVLDKLDRELVGLKPVKTRIREIAALLLVDKLRKGMGLTAGAPSLHMSFTGNPGTGKTTVALRMAEILHRLGYIRRPEVISVTRDDLVGQYIGHTAPKTKEVLKKAMGGVLFIDEAYYLYKPENERDYGAESIEILLQVMENQRDDLVVILAGYKDRMDTFFKSNPGFSSRVAHHLDFPDFAADELMHITQMMVQQQQYRLSPDAEQAFYDYIQRRMQMPQFANARSIRNALDRSRLRQANRLYAKGGTLTREQLMTIEAEDILASRVFQEGKPDDLQEEAASEKKTLENVRKVDKPVAIAPAPVPSVRRETTIEPPHVIQDSPMQTNMTPNESAQPNSPSADAGFGGMPRPLPLAKSASGWQKRNQRATSARRPAVPPVLLREPPTVVNGHCEFGQCEHETQTESAVGTAGTGQRVPPAAQTKPTSLPTKFPAQASGVTAEAGSDVATDAASGFGVPRELHAPRVVVRRVSNITRKKAARDRTPPPPPQINRPQPVVVNGRCEFGQCEAPSKVEEAATTGGQIVTGTNVERSVRVTGNEPGSCKKITGTEYIGPDQYTALCASAPYVPPAKVGVTHTVGSAQRVTGTEVGPSSKVTGDERGAGKRVTGNEYLNAEQFELLTASKPHPGPAKVGVSATYAGQRVSGSEVGRSSKVTGDEPGACLKLTGSQYVQPDPSGKVCQGSGVPHKVSVMSTVRERPVTGTDVSASTVVTGSEYGACKNVTGTEYAGLQQYQACNRTPVLTPEKVSVLHTWRDQAVSGTSVEHNPKVTGDEYGGCQPISGTEYIGPGQYAAICASDRLAASRERVATARGAAGASMTGVRQGTEHKVTGSARGNVQHLSGTPYSDDAKSVLSGAVGMSQHHLTRGPVGQSQASATTAATPVQRNFSVLSPARTAHESQLNRVTGTASGAQGRITGPVNLAAGLVSGTPEFRYKEDSAVAVEKPASAAPTNRITGEGREAGFAITGAAWQRGGSTTGTEGSSATRRNLTQRGEQRSMAMQTAAMKKEREHPPVAPSKITGSSGNTATGSTITYSGGARG